MKIEVNDNIIDDIFIEILKKDYILTKGYGKNSTLQDDILMYEKVSEAYKTILEYCLPHNEFKSFIDEQA